MIGAIQRGGVEASLEAPSGTISAKAAVSESEGRATLTLALDADGTKNGATLFIDGESAAIEAPTILGGAYGVRLDNSAAESDAPPASTAEYDLRRAVEFCSKVSAILGRLKATYDAGGWRAAAIERLDGCVTAVGEQKVELAEGSVKAIAVEYRLSADDIAALGVPLDALVGMIAKEFPEISAFIDADGASLSATVLIERSSRRAIRIDGSLDLGASVTICADFTPDDGEEFKISAVGAAITAVRRVKDGKVDFTLNAATIGASADFALAYDVADGSLSLEVTTNGLPFDVTARAAGTLAVGDGAATFTANSLSLAGSEILAPLTVAFRQSEKLPPAPEFEFISELDEAGWAALAANVAANGDTVRAISKAIPAIIDEALNTPRYGESTDGETTDGVSGTGSDETESETAVEDTSEG